MPTYTRSLSAFGAFGSLMDVTSHNIANVNTDGYKSFNLNFTSGPEDQGVRVGRISQDYSPGPAIVDNIRHDSSSAMNARPSQLEDQVNAQSILSREYAGKNEHGEYVATWDKAASREYTEPIFKSYAESSNVDLPREFANLTISETAYGANAAVVRTIDDTTGSLLNIVT